MPRHDKKAYTTILARVPQALADEVKRYASQHRVSVSELLRDGLEMRLEAGDVPGRSTGDHGDAGEEVLHEVLQAITALSPMGQAAVRQTITEVLHEVLPIYVDRQQRAHRGMTEVLPGHTEVCPPHDPGQAMEREGMTEVLQCITEVLPSEISQGAHDQHGITEVLPHNQQGDHVADEVIHEVLQTGTAPAFDSTRFVLGRLCSGGHAYHDTGQTLYRLPKRVCPPCDAARARERRKRRRTAAAREG